MAYLTEHSAKRPVQSYFSSLSAQLKARATRYRDRNTCIRMLKLDNRTLNELGLTRDEIREQIVRAHQWPKV